MKFSDLNNLDPNNIGSWPGPVKAVVLVILCIATLFAGYKYDIQDQQEALASVESEEETLRQRFEAKQRKAANLEPLKRQLEEMKQTFGDLLRQLPSRTEVAALLVDISQQGLASGLEFKLFEPGKEVPAEFYAELPIRIEVTGTYHEFGAFVSGVAALPRIVTQHDISITVANEDTGELSMQSTAKTYRYLDEDEEEAAQ